MDFRSLPKDMQEKILKLASEHLITIEQAKECYLMGGDHVDVLCRLVVAKVPYCIIEMENNALWKNKNDKLWKELRNLSV